MTTTISRYSLLLGTAIASLFLAGLASAQPKNPPYSSAMPMPCPGGMMQGPGMMDQGNQAMMGGQMMNWQQMQADMQGLREEMAKLRLELQKRGKR
jgi:hypothetical protein